MNRERELFLEALDHPPGAPRERFLAAVGEEDPALAGNVRGLLAAHEGGPGPLDRSPSPAASASRPLGWLAEGPGTLIDRYRLVKKLGEGGFGTVFLAEQDEPVRRRVALKIVKPGMDSGRVIARFETERQALALMSHPNIARVLDAGTTAHGRPYFVMELVEGLPLTHYCDENRLAIRDRLTLFLQVCAAIHHAHQRGILHRDIKPGNVLVAMQDDAPVPKVIDFGIAKAIQADADAGAGLTRPHELVGTPAYMSPEQTRLSGQDVDTRTDVYSLGVLLYELLTGHTPLDTRELLAGDYEELCRRLRDQAPPKPSARLGALPPDALADIAHRRQSTPRLLVRMLRGDLDRIVTMAMEKDRDHRYESARELADDIRRLLANEPVVATPPAFAYRLRKFVRRHRAAVAAAVLVALTLIAGTGVSLWLAREARREAARAKAEAETASAVTRFLNDDLFSMADPTAQPDREITVRALLDRASRQLPGGLKNQPLALAAIHGTLGRTYARLSDHEQANRHLRHAYSMYLQELGERDERTIGALLAMAGSPDPSRSLEEVTSLVEKARDLAMAELGPNHALTVRCLISLSWRYYSARRQADARQTAALAWEAAQHVFSTPEGEAWQALHMLARQHSAAGEVAAGEALLRRAADVVAARFGPQHHWTVRAREGLAAYLYDRGLHLDEAERLYRESLEAQLALYGEEHDAPQRVRRNLALLLEATDRIPQAYQELVTILDRRPAIRETHSDMDRLRTTRPLRSLAEWSAPPAMDWRFSGLAPGEAWHEPEYADEGWPTSAPEGARDLWVRCHVNLTSPLPPNARLLIRWAGTGRAEVFINGQSALREPRRPRVGERYGVCNETATSRLRPGKNVLALRVRDVPSDGTRLPNRLGIEWLVFEPGR